MRDIAADDPISAVGVGCGGPMRWPQGEVSPLNMPGWNAFPLRARLLEEWPVEVVVHNDAIAFTLGEQRSGAARGWRDVLGIVVSTGVGGGLILDGKIRSGPTGNAGHLGHLVVDPGGPLCGCGGRGCVEAIARGPATVEWALAQGWRPGGRRPTGRELAVSAAAGDEIVRAAFARSGRAVGLAIAGAAALLDLEGVVVGGGVTGAGDLFFDPMRVAITQHARLGFTREVAVVRSGLGRTAGLVGAAALVATAPTS